MHPLVALAYTTIVNTLEKGEAKGHEKDGWRTTPKEVQLLKAIRHAITSIGLANYPEYFKDDETDIEHGEQALVRFDMYLRNLLDERKRSEQSRK
ncbi:MAG: hypothetical protein EBR82_37530 [Caulobacteraceae bacterium]|nr:hypothetical protein [Caulobacteraceae bacterium]